MVQSQSQSRGAMHSSVRETIDHGLRSRIAELISHRSPILDAVEYALFPGGARLRPSLALAVASDFGLSDVPLVRDVAHAVELIHCASLVHDDLPCFDDAELRRGRPSLHRKFDEATAVLVGDALIIAAFECLARPSQGSARCALPEVRLRATAELAASSGARSGLIAGQAFETREAALREHGLQGYHRAKTAALFEFAVVMPAMAATALGRAKDAGAWRKFARWVGVAYQIADDLLDINEGATGQNCGKPTGQDLRHGRPSAIVEYGTTGARQQLATTLDQAKQLAHELGAGQAVRSWLSGLDGALTRHLENFRNHVPEPAWRRGSTGSVLCSEAVHSHLAKNY